MAADPQLAVSYTHVVVTARAAFAAYTKSGLLVSGPTNGKTFWVLGGIPDHGSNWNIGDMRIVYDAYRQRFFMSTLYAGVDTNNKVLDGEQLLVAVSKSTDPTQGWWIYSFDMPFHSTSPPPAWQSGDTCDYDTLGVGPTVYLMTANWFSGAGALKGSDIYMFDANAMANGNSPAGWIFYNWTNPDGSPIATMQPAVHHGSTGSANTVWFATHWNGYALVYNHVDNPLKSNQAAWTTWGAMTATSLPLVTGPQKGVTNPTPPPMDMGNQVGDWFLKAAWRNNRLYLTTTNTFLQNGVRLSAARVLRKNTSTAALEVDKTFGDSTTGTSQIHYGWAAVEANANGDMIIPTSRTSSAMFPEIRVSQWLSGDSTIEPDFLLKSGEAPYHEGSVCIPPSGGNPGLPWECWGETTGVSVDPTDDLGIWVTFEYPVPVPPGQNSNYPNHSLWVGQLGGSGCGHSVCTTGQPIPQSCDGICVYNVCNQDSYCCNVAWDSICVSEVPTYCAGASCNNQSP
ncbi:MAG TPA: hypothetical protein VHE33_20440 [Acidobacteriaceae bacterium]|nr:hypothetical protein [Acidobacteriaceae bacterium]